MAADRHAESIAETINADDEEARRVQARDAARIHRELAGAERLATSIDELLRDDRRDSATEAGEPPAGRS